MLKNAGANVIQTHGDNSQYFQCTSGDGMRESFHSISTPVWFRVIETNL